MEQQVTQKEWFICEESGKKFQTPDGARCHVCKRMVLAEFYVYVDMSPTCLKCRQKEINDILRSIKESLS